MIKQLMYKQLLSLIKKFIWLFLICLPLGYLIYFIFKYRVDFPFRDQWALVPFLEKYYRGTLSFKDLYSQHSEHRLFFPRIIMITLAVLTRWNMFYELCVNILLAMGIFAISTYQIGKTLKSFGIKSKLWVVPIISLIVFSAGQYENFVVNGFGIPHLLNTLAVIIGIVLLSNSPLKWTTFPIAIIFGIIATYSTMSGICYWYVGLLILFFYYRNNKKAIRPKVILWCVVAFVVSLSYLYDFHRPPPLPSLSFIYEHPFEYIKFIFKYLGAPVSYFSTKFAYFMCLFGFTILGYTIWLLIKIRSTKLQSLTPYIYLSLYSISTAILTGIGRGGWGNAEPFNSRYLSNSNLFWISNVTFLYLFILNGNFGIGILKKIRKILILFLIIIVVSVSFSSILGSFKIVIHYYTLLPARNKLLLGSIDSDLLARLHIRARYYDLRKLLDILKRYQLSIFRAY